MEKIMEGFWKKRRGN